MRRRLPLGLILPAALVLLVGALAALQYRWLGQVSEAERDELRTSLERRAVEFADDFDREVSRAYTTFQSAEPASEPGAPPVLDAAFAKWREAARFPALVKDVYFLHGDGSREVGTLQRYVADRAAFERAEWTPALEAIRTRMAPNLDQVLPPAIAPGARTQVITFTSTTVISEIPAVLVPIAPRATYEPFSDRTPPPAPAGAGSIANVFVAMRLPHDYLVLVFDRDVIVNDILPVLADRHFESDRYRVAVVDQAATPLITRGLPSGVGIDPDKADVTAPLFALRPEITRDTKAVSLFTANGTAIPRSPRGQGGQVSTVTGVATGEVSMRVEQRSTTPSAANIRISRSGWSVLVQHSAGSLDAAVTQARHRNLWISFGILGVLLTGVGLIVFNARKSERLADQQMDFVATVSHELRTPVTVIRSAAQNLSAGVVQNTEQAKRYGDLIETEGRRLTEMVEQVLTYAGLSGNRTLRTQPTDAGVVVHDALEACAGLLDADRFVSDVTIAPDLPPVLADDDALRRALQNLIGNAVKYGADGHWIGIVVSVAGAGRREVQIAVSDRGRGIEPADLPHLFEPFYRGHYAQERQIHGNGLGLSLVKRIAEAHGGRVAVKSALGQGSTFTMYLPALAADASAQLEEVTTSAGPAA